MADDDDTIWVEVKARVDEASADEAAETLREKLKGAAEGAEEGLKGFGDKIKDEFSGLGDKFKDLFSHDIPKELEDQLKGSIGGVAGDLGSALGRGVGDALHDVLGKGDLGSALDHLKGIGSELGGIFDKIDDKLGNLGKLGNVLSGDSDNPLKDLTEGISGLGFKVPGPIGDLSHANDIINSLNEHPGAAEDWLTQNFGFVLNPLQDLLTRGPQELGESLHNQIFGYPAQFPQADTRLQDEFAKQNPIESFQPESIGAAGSMSSSMSASLMDVSAGTVNVSGSVSGVAGLGASATGAGASGLIGSAGSSTGGVASSGDGYAQLSSFSQGGDVPDVGGIIGEDSVPALLAPGEEVLTPAQKQLWMQTKPVQHFAGGGDVAAPDVAAPSSDDSSGGASPGGDDSGGGSDEGGDGGAPGTVGGTQAPGAVQPPSDQEAEDAVGQPGQDDVVDPTQDSIAGGTKTSKGIQDESYGYGKGFQVTGQGLIGFAESAPGLAGTAAASGASVWGPEGAAAGPAAALAAAAWNSIGEPELNEAITEGVKVGADLASAPSQEFAIGGENFQNWTQKLIGGEIGNVTNLINTAASTQAPLTPQQGSGLAGEAAEGSQGQLGGQPAPTGSPGDPMHVFVSGANTSGAASSNAMTSLGTSSSQTA